MTKIAVGEKIDHYQLLEWLGAGGMGDVYKANDLKLERIVAIKFLLPEELQLASARKRFIREARAAAVLNHPNIATIFDIGEIDDHLFIVMEYCEGSTLAELLENLEFSISEILDISIQILSALQAAHERKIIHRDIKTSNILLTKKGRVKVLDFGIAKILRDSELVLEARRGDLELSAESLTGSDQILGSANYVSPEQALKEKIDGRSDLFSFGVVLYQLITRQLPFDATDKIDILIAIIKHEPLPLSHHRKDLPPRIQKIVSRCLAKQPAKRYNTARDVRVRLQALAEEIANPAESTNETQKLNKRFDWLNLLIMFLVLIAGMLGLLLLLR